MKKRFKIFYRLLMISVILQSLVYLYVDKGYLGNRKNVAGKFTFTTAASSGESQTLEDIQLPKNVANVQVSYDLSYVSYLKDGKLEIMNWADKKLVKTVDNSFPMENGVKSGSGQKAVISCYQWLPDKNLVVYVLSATGDSPGKVQFFTFDADSENEFVGKALTGNQIPKGSQANEMIVSSLNMTTYLKIKVSDTQAKLYRIDINNTVSEPVSLEADAIIRVGNYTDQLLYQNKDLKLFTRRGLDPISQVPVKNKAVLLGVEGDKSSGKDVFYLGELNADSKVQRIVYRSDPNKWDKIELKKPVKADKLKLGSEGQVYELSDGKFTRLTDGKAVEFSGKFIGYTNGLVVYSSNNVLKTKAF